MSSDSVRGQSALVEFPQRRCKRHEQGRPLFDHVDHVDGRVARPAGGVVLQQVVDVDEGFLVHPGRNPFAISMLDTG